MNPVIFGSWEQEPGFVPLSPHLSEFDYEGKLVGFTNEGFLCGGKKVSRLGYYEFLTEFLPWNEVQQVTISRCLGLKGILGGTVSIVIGFFAAKAAWNGAANNQPQAIKFAVVGLLLGPIFIFGAWRNRIRVRTATKSFTWTCPPLGYRRSLAHCQTLTLLCVERQVAHTSHLSESFLNYQ